MTIEELRAKLEQIGRDFGWDTEALHSKADKALLEFINDEWVSKFYEDTDMWYA